MSIIDTSSTKGDSIEVLLRQIGATKITKVKGYLYFIKFNIDEIEITYTYNINHKNQYFLQRIEPYPLGKGVFNNEIEIVSFIKKDISKFKAAKQLIDFDKFLNLNNKVADLTTKLEHLFLNYDVSSIDIEKLQSMLDSFGEEVNDLRKNSRKVK